MTPKLGGRYNWKNQPERLVYLGMCEPRNGRWHQFAKVESPEEVWCEVLEVDLHLLEETQPGPQQATPKPNGINGVQQEQAPQQATPVGSISKAHLRPTKTPWCKTVLMYSPDNTGDYPENRVMVYLGADPTTFDIDQKWKNEVVDGLVIAGILTADHETNPSKALQDLITWHTQVALDPSVSSDARALVESGRNSKGVEMSGHSEFDDACFSIPGTGLTVTQEQCRPHVWAALNHLSDTVKALTCDLVQANTRLCAIDGHLPIADHRDEVTCEACQTTLDPAPIRKAALALYKPPFRYLHGYIYDADMHIVADSDKMNIPAACRIRGWGRIQYLPDPSALQDEVGAMVAEAMTAYWLEHAPKAEGWPMPSVQLTASG